MLTPRPPQPAPLTRVDPTRLVDSARTIWDDGYVAGYAAGVALEQARGGYGTGRADGWRAHADHDHLSWQVMARFVREAGSPRAMTYERLHRLRHPDWVHGPVPSIEACMATWTTSRAVSA